MPYGEVMKFRAKSCEREENAWVPGWAKGRGQKTNCKADRTAWKRNNFIAQYFGETKLTFIRGCKS